MGIRKIKDGVEKDLANFVWLLNFFCLFLLKKIIHEVVVNFAGPLFG